jgi:hypothetical protein
MTGEEVPDGLVMFHSVEGGIESELDTLLLMRSGLQLGLVRDLAGVGDPVTAERFRNSARQPMERCNAWKVVELYGAIDVTISAMHRSLMPVIDDQHRAEKDRLRRKASELLAVHRGTPELPHELANVIWKVMDEQQRAIFARPSPTEGHMSSLTRWEQQLERILLRSLRD